PVASGAPMAIAKGTRNRAAALRFIDFRLAPEPQKGFCQQMWYGPSNKQVKLDPKYAAKVAYGTEHYAKLLAPSACGKTTTLNIIAGFLEPSRGTVSLGGRVVNQVPPYRRNTGMVFQSYALFPHMNVFDNVAFGLRIRRLPAAETARRVREALALVRLEGLGDRAIRQLSGGQQQRVAIARALAIDPLVLLMDEPLSN